MRYQIYFQDQQKKDYLFLARKYLQRDPQKSIAGVQEILHDYTTAYCRLSESDSGEELGTGLLKFKTFENLAAIENCLSFIKSFRVSGTDNPVFKAQAELKFLAFTDQSLIHE